MARGRDRDRPELPFPRHVWRSMLQRSGLSLPDLSNAAADLNTMVETLSVPVRNETGSTLTQNSLVYVSGANSDGEALVALADADNSSTMPALGFVSQDIVNNGDGRVVVLGLIRDVPLPDATYDVGDEIYVSTTPGTCTKTAPTGSATAQRVGFVTKVGTTDGEAFVFGPSIEGGSVSGSLTGLGLTSTGQRLIGRASSGSGAIEELELGNGLAFGTSPSSLGVADSGIGSTQLGTSAVTTTKLNDSAVTTVKINDGAVTTAKLGSLSVTGDIINDNSVTTNKIVNLAVTNIKIALGAVGTNQLADDAVTGPKIADAAVCTDQICDDGVTQAKVAAGAICTTELCDGGVTTAKIADGAVTAAKLADSAVSGVKLANTSVGTSKIASSAITASLLASSAVETAKISDTAVTTRKIADANVTAAKLAADAKVSTMLAVGTSTASVANTTIYASWDTASSDALADSTGNIQIDDEDSGTDTSDNTIVNIHADGRYQIDCSFRMSGNNRIEAFCRTWLDTGSGFVRQSMHTASNYSSRDSDQNTGVVTLSTILSLSSGDKLKFQAEADADGTANMVLNGTLLRIIRHP